MTRLAAKTLIALAVAAALALAGCGGDDDSATTTGGNTNTTTGPGPEAQKQLERARQKAKQDEKQGGSGGGESTATVPFREPTGAAPTTSGSLPNEGSKDTAPGVPLAKGGDNSIQTFGVEASSEDRIQASRILQAYLDARLAGDWALACSYLSGSMRAGLEQFGRQAQRSGSEPLDCTAVMRAFTAGVSKEVLRTAADIHVLSMRVEGGQAFLIYRSGEGTPTSIPMGEEGGDWKVGAIAGNPLFLSV